MAAVLQQEVAEEMRYAYGSTAYHSQSKQATRDQRGRLAQYLAKIDPLVKGGLFLQHRVCDSTWAVLYFYFKRRRESAYCQFTFIYWKTSTISHFVSEMRKGQRGFTLAVD